MLIKQVAKRGLCFFLWRIVRMRDWLLKNTTNLIKWITPLMLLMTIFMFLLHDKGLISLPDFVAMNEHQLHAVMFTLFFQIFLHLLFLFARSDCQKIAVWHSWLLGFSGFSMGAVGGGFIAHYPPFSLLMAFFPVLGFLIAFAGLDINKRARFELNQQKQKQK